MPYRRYSGPLVPGTTSVRQVNRRVPVSMRGNAKFVPKNSYKNPNSYVTRIQNAYRKYKTTKPTVATLSKAINNIQRTQLGSYQKNYQSFSLNLGTGMNDLNVGSPVAFALNNFLASTPVFNGRVDIGDPTHPVHIAHTPTHFNDIAIPNADSIQAKYNYWNMAQDDTCSKRQYLPISTNVNLKVSFPSLPTNHHPIWIRVDVFRMIKVLDSPTTHDYDLPANLPGLGHMADDSIQTKNRFNKQYFKLYFTKWMKINNDDQATKDVERFCKFRFTFPNKILKLDCDHAISGVTQDFHTNMPQRDIYWCMISTNTDLPHNESCTLQCTRFISWRDQSGVAS